MRFLAIGECMAELAPFGASGEFKLGFAGDTFNTAWYMAQLSPDADVAYYTALGDDALSSEMRSFMRDSGIDTSAIREIAGGSVGLYMIHLADGERSFSYWRSSSAATQLAADPADLDSAIAEADVIYYSGITLGILGDPSRENLLSAVQRARAAGKVVAFDTNIRPKLWPSADHMTRTIMQAAQQSDIVLPSFDDEAEWFGDDSPLATLERYAELGVQQIIVKNSSQSVIYRDGDFRGEIGVTPAARVIDTTAAGDSFNAGVLLSLLDGTGIAAGISGGCKLASHVVQSKGALVSICRGHFQPVCAF